MVENNTVRVYCFCAVRANQVSSCSAPRTRSSVPRTITEIGLFSTKRANTLPSMVASPRKSVSKACSVPNGEWEDHHLNRAGGQGFASTLAFFTRSGIPPVLALLVIVTELLGPLGLALGLLTRMVAFGLLCEMLVAIVTVHWPHGFFMNWTGTQQGEGFEYHLLVIGMALTVLIVGAGAWSIDRALAGRPPRSLAQN